MGTLTLLSLRIQNRRAVQQWCSAKVYSCWTDSRMDIDTSVSAVSRLGIQQSEPTVTIRC